MNRLIPRSVEIGGEFKGWGFIDGISAGTSLKVNYDIPEGTSPLELELLITVARFQLDVICVNTEAMRGTVNPKLAAEIQETNSAAFQKRVGELKRRIQQQKTSQESPGAPHPAEEDEPPLQNPPHNVSKPSHNVSRIPFDDDIPF